MIRGEREVATRKARLVTGHCLLATDLLVGAPGFEPGTSCAQGKRATRLRHAPRSLGDRE